MQRILIVDDEVDFAKGLERMISLGFPSCSTLTAHNGTAALAILESEPVSVMLLDLNMPEMHGMEVLAALREKELPVSVIVLTAYGTVETAVNALKSGAWDFLTKPVQREELFRSLAKALEHHRLLSENRQLRQSIAASGMGKGLVGDSPAMCLLRERIAAVAASSYTVLIRGESGTGKELVAEAIHNLSDRSGGPFVKVNCPAIPEQLLESELFGHARGAFTGATEARKGLFVQADGGSLLLDEVGDIPLTTQVKLLRALQDGEIRPVGATRSIKVNARILAATNQDLEAKIAAGTFREDLFYRLNVLSLQTPPLREHKEDLPLLAMLFLDQACAEMAVPPKKLSPASMAALAAHDWPGNTRELQNFIRQQAVFSVSSTVEIEPGFSGISPSAQSGPEATQPYKEAKNELVESFTRHYMHELLSRTGGNISEAARLSGLERVSLQKILRRLDISRESFR